MNEQATLFSRGIEVPKKSAGTYVVRILVVALLLAMIPMTPAWAAHVTITLSPPTDTNTVGDPHVVTATVEDTAPAPVSGTVVTFTASGTGGESPSQATATTDSNGVATFTFTSTKTGTSSITASVTDSVSAPVTKDWTPGPANAGQSTLEPATATNTVGTNHTVTMTLKDANGNPVTDTEVDFTATGTGAEDPNNGPDRLTDENGQASFTFTSEVPGTSQITATGDGVTKTATKNWVVGGVDEVDVDPDSATNRVGTPHTVTATVTDEFGNPISGETVTWTVSGDTTDESPDSEVDVTNDDGQVSFTFTSSQEGTSLITATTENGEFDSVEKTWEAGHIHICDNEEHGLPPHGADNEPTSTVTCSDEASNEVNTTHTVTGTVHDNDGNVPPSGTVVTYTLVFESRDDGDDEPDSTQTVVRTTNAQGRTAPISFNSTISGETVITAVTVWDGVTVTSNPFEKTWDPGPLTHYHFDFDSPQFPEVCFPITVTAHDVFHNQTNAPQTNIQVISSDGSENLDMFNSPNCNGNPRDTFSINGERTISAIDHDLNGETLTLRAVSRAQQGPIVTDSQPLVILNQAGGPPDDDDDDEEPPPLEPGEPANVEITPGSDTNVVGENHTVVAQVTDVSDTAVAGTSVNWTVSGTDGENPTAESDTTDANGRATFTFTSSNVGRSTIFATAGGAQGSATKDWVCDDEVGNSAPTFNIDIARDLALSSECGGYVLDGFGAVHTFGDAPTALPGTTPYFPNFDIARELVLVRDENLDVTGGYVLDGWGALHPFMTDGGELPPVAAADKPYFPGVDIARDVVLTGLNQDSNVYGGYLLDGRGAIHGFGGNSGLAGAPYFTFDIARELLFAPGEESTESGWVLDGWGALHPFGDKEGIFGQPYFPGHDIANDALMTGSESGFLLDGFGGIHSLGFNDPIQGSAHPYTLGSDNYPAFDLIGVNKGLILNDRGNIFDWFPGHVE